MGDKVHTFLIKLSSPLFCVFLVLAIITGAENVKGGTAADFDGDGKADISVFRPFDGFWHIAKSSGGFSSVRWGLSTDRLVPGDYDGDGRTDIAVYRAPLTFNPNSVVNHNWYVLKSSDNAFFNKQWGTSSGYEWDTPAIADYDGDGITDFAVYTLSDGVGGSGRFKILQSSDNLANVSEWGTNTDLRIPADYDGDGRADLAVYRASRFGTAGGTEINVWYILQSSTNTIRTVSFGLTTDSRVPADYDGDGKADIAVFRPSNGFWYRVNSRDNSFQAVQFGLSDDILVPADYDGDGKTDVAVWRPSTGVWYLQRSTAGFTAQQFGLNGDFPIPNRR